MKKSKISLKTSHRQLSFDSEKAFRDFKKRYEHGHGIREGKRKLARPFDPNKAQHINLRSSKAKGSWSFLKTKNEEKIKKIVYGYAERSGVKVYNFANVGNHLHIIVKAKSKKSFQRYLRTITGLIPRAVTSAKKGKPKGKFWDGLAYTKLITWGKQFKSTDNYIWQNKLEVWGIIPTRDRKKKPLNMDYKELFRELYGGEELLFNPH